MSRWLKQDYRPNRPWSISGSIHSPILLAHPSTLVCVCRGGNRTSLTSPEIGIDTMWRRIISSHLKSISAVGFCVAESSHLSLSTRASSTPAYSSIFTRQIGSAAADTAVKKRVEDVMPIATGHEKEELEAELEGRKLDDIDFPQGPFGTKEAPAVVKSYYDMRIVGCPGGEGEDEHDVVWFWLEKAKPFECPVCTQYFKLEVVGPGGPPDGHGDDHH